MKVLFLSNYRESSGYSHGAREFILSLDATGVEVVPRNIKILGNSDELPQRIKELEDNHSYDCDYCIQYTLPNFFHYQKYDFKKVVGFFATETSHFRPSSWAERCNMMDEIWVINHESKQACVNSGVTKPVKVTCHSVDFDRLRSSTDTLDIPEARNAYKFYFIGEYNSRKNIENLIRTYYSAFDISDNVVLILKTSMAGKSPEESDLILQQIQNDIKLKTKLRNPSLYPNIINLTDRLTTAEMDALHRTCDCFVTMTHGEAWCIPAFEGRAVGNTCILPNIGPFNEFMDSSALLIDGQESLIYGVNDSFGDLYTGHETWHNYPTETFVNAMRHHYESYKPGQKFAPRLGYTSREVVGGTLHHYLES